MDRLHRELLIAVLADDEDASKAMVVDVTLLGRYYERFADHTVEVGRRTVFMAAGCTPQEWTTQHHGPIGHS
jgi:phosphate transport system protein